MVSLTTAQAKFRVDASHRHVITILLVSAQVVFTHFTFQHFPPLQFCTAFSFPAVSPWLSCAVFFFLTLSFSHIFSVAILARLLGRRRFATVDRLGYLPSNILNTFRLKIFRRRSNRPKCNAHRPTHCDILPRQVGWCELSTTVRLRLWSVIVTCRRYLHVTDHCSRCCIYLSPHIALF